MVDLFRDWDGAKDKRSPAYEHRAFVYRYRLSRHQSYGARPHGLARRVQEDQSQVEILTRKKRPPS
jgi:hypothetical protein